MGLSSFLNAPVQTRGLRRGSKLATTNSSSVAFKWPNLDDTALVTQPPSQSAPLPPLQNGANSLLGWDDQNNNFLKQFCISGLAGHSPEATCSVAFHVPLRTSMARMLFIRCGKDNKEFASPSHGPASDQLPTQSTKQLEHRAPQERTTGCPA